MARMIPLWIRRLPHNLSTVRPAVRLWVTGSAQPILHFVLLGPKPTVTKSTEAERLRWALSAEPFFQANKGDKDYLFHFEEAGLLLKVGPLRLLLGLIDTPEENALIP